MAERVQKQVRAERHAEVSEAEPTSKEHGDRLKAELDDLLDEIDDVLEANAEAFVKNYIQIGGQ